jgi:hypothetical protein
MTEDQGHSFDIISPDLSRNDPKTTGETGGPITKDQTGAEVYATIFTLSESTLEKIWTGSDDGLVHIPKQWSKLGEHLITNNSIADFSLISMIHTSDHQKGSILNR